jgi:hypothetical protein
MQFMIKDKLQEIINSWDNIPLAIIEIVSNREYYAVLMEIAIYSNDKNSWRAAYMIDKIHEKYPEFILPFVDSIVEQLRIENHPGKKRHFLKQISLNEIPEKYFGFLTDYCLTAFTSDKEAIAVRVHAMQILFNISEKEFDLKHEILAVIEHEMEFHATAGILSRGKKLAKKLHLQIQERQKS